MKKLEEVEVYDRNGNQLKIENIIYSFLKTKGHKTDVDLEHVYIGAGMCGGCAYLGLIKAYDNGDDAYNLISFGQPIYIKEE